MTIHGGFLREKENNKASPRATKAARLMTKPALSREVQLHTPEPGLSRAVRQDTRQDTGLLGTHGPATPSSPTASPEGSAASPAPRPDVPRLPAALGAGHSPGLTRCPRPAAPPPLTQHRGGSLARVTRPRDPRPCPGPAALAPYPRELRRWP